MGQKTTETHTRGRGTDALETALQNHYPRVWEALAYRDARLSGWDLASCRRGDIDSCADVELEVMDTLNASRNADRAIDAGDDGYGIVYRDADDQRDIDVDDGDNGNVRGGNDPF